ncbi:IS110 family transposase [Rhabdobacter roseus]|uniref:Transposase n=1 Tax=Rhabdobacter roseus TaxID=1655419 RepID=A0A840TYM7_9BACT|nr:IS110 family transposase [Rhabdobacter roseus]MBB5285298.1 transposase [Rhabdobacter roseus]
MITNYIGIDIAARSFVSARPTPTASYQIQRWDYQTPQQIARFIESLNPQTDQCVLEATGNYHLRLTYALLEAGISVSVVNPLSVKRYGQMLASITKTDQRDAVLLARYGQQQRPAPYRQPDQHLQYLRQRRMVLSQLQQQRQALANQQHALCVHPQPDAFSQQILDQQLVYIEQAIADLQAQINQLVADHYQQSRQLLASIPGFGTVSTAVFLEALAGFEGWQQPGASKAFVKYIGLAPTLHQSGRSVRGGSHINRSAVPWLRQKLWLPACTLAMRLKTDTVFQRLYIRLRQGGESFKEAIIAVMHKWVRVALAVLQSGKPFDPGLNLTTEENLANAL